VKERERVSEGERGRENGCAKEREGVSEGEAGGDAAENHLSVGRSAVRIQ